MTATCSLDGCNKPTYARGMCCAHYKRYLKARPSGAAQPRRPAADADPSITERTSLPELLTALAAALPPLPDARCRGHWELFDATIVGLRGRHHHTLRARATAISICNECPALTACAAWLDRLPADARPLGVTAGRLTTPDRPQPKGQNQP